MASNSVITGRQSVRFHKVWVNCFMLMRISPNMTAFKQEHLYEAAGGKAGSSLTSKEYMFKDTFAFGTREA